MSDENSYKKILKVTSLFGGVQVFQIIVNLVRGKFVALFLGPAGMGISSLFSSAFNTITQFSTLGMNLAFVKETAARHDDAKRLSEVRHIAMLLIRMAALLGCIICAFSSRWLSELSFGTTDYAWQFVLLSAAVFLTVYAQGKMAVLQGLRKVRIISVTSLAGALSGLIAGVPLYYFFGTRGIVPAMVILALTSFGFYSYGLKKALPRQPEKLNLRQQLPLIKHIIGMGLILLSSGLINTGCIYAVNIFIRYSGNLADVGLFNAANSITLQYTGVVFSAMAMDYFPRLSACASNPGKMRTVINKQMEIVALIAAPMAILLVGSAPLLIRLLLTDAFLPVTPLMRWLGLSILLKAIAYPLGYIAFAKDNKLLFFILEGIICNALYLLLAIAFYHAFGLIGLGYAAALENACCILIYLGINFKVYGFFPNSKTSIETIIGFALGCAGFCTSLITDSIISYCLTALVFIIAAIRSFIILRTRIKTDQKSSS